MTRKERIEELNNHALFKMSVEKRKAILDTDYDNEYKDEIAKLIYFIDGQILDYKLYGNDDSYISEYDTNEKYENMIDESFRSRPGEKITDTQTFLEQFNAPASYEAMVKALETYSSEEGASFYTYYRNIYDNANKDYYMREEVVPVSQIVYRLYCNARSLNRSHNFFYDEHEIIEMMKSDPRYSNHSEKTWEKVEKYMTGGYLIKSLDYENPDEGENAIPFGHTLEDEKQAEQIEAIYDTTDDDILRGIEMLYRNWQSLTKASQCKIYALDVTKMLMKSLKLDEGKHHFTDYPAGNEGIYELLVKADREFMNKVFEYDYARSVVESGPESTEKIYGIYYNYLNEGISFTDKEVAEYIGKEPSSYARSLKTIAEKVGAMKREYRN